MFGFLNKRELKGFKVCKNEEKQKKYGIAAESLKKLREKITDKFKIEKFDLFFKKSLINSEDYFSSIPNQSVIVVVNEGDELKTDYDIMLDLFRKTFEDAFHARELVKEFLRDNQNENVLSAVMNVHSKILEKTQASTYEEHPEWFDGTKKTSKEEVMRMKGKDRIKGYFYKTQDELTKSLIYRSNAEGRKLIDDLLEDFFLFLNGVEYFECIFDRSHDQKLVIADETDARAIAVKRRRIDADTKIKIKESNLFDEYLVSLCNEAGWFDCHGIWSADNCAYKHRINPYASRESLILFQTFNLDHQIEISRSIFPSILKNVERLCNIKEEEILCEDHKKPCTQLSTLTYFYEIFTIKNLKLVHIVCHDKGSHVELESAGKLLCDNCKEAKLLKKIKMRIK